MEGVVVVYAGKETTSERLAFLTPTDEGSLEGGFRGLRANQQTVME